MTFFTEMGKCLKSHIETQKLMNDQRNPEQQQ